MDGVSSRGLRCSLRGGGWLGDEWTEVPWVLPCPRGVVTEYLPEDQTSLERQPPFPRPLQPSLRHYEWRVQLVRRLSPSVPFTHDPTVAGEWEWRGVDGT